MMLNNNKKNIKNAKINNAKNNNALNLSALNAEKNFKDKSLLTIII